MTHILKFIASTLFVSWLLYEAFSLPLNRNRTLKAKFRNKAYQNEYKNYVKQILQELQNDIQLTKKIMNSNTTNPLKEYIRQLPHASQSTRNKLDEIKRKEINRLNEMDKKLKKLINDNDFGNQSDWHNKLVNYTMKKQRAHVNEKSSNFTADDMKIVISNIIGEINEVDSLNEKRYRLHKLKKLWTRKKIIDKIKDPKLRKEEEDKFLEEKKAFSKHQRLHEPGSEEQFKEIWEKKDNLGKSMFNPKTFFYLHDLNQDGVWDINEIEALVQNEIDKVYKQNDTIADDIEQFHETMRMRKHMMEKIDKDKDNIITLEEFMHYAEDSDQFKKDEEWKTMEEGYLEEESNIDNFENDVNEMKEDFEHENDSV